MNKQQQIAVAVAVLLVLILVGSGYYYKKAQAPKSAAEAVAAIQETTASTTENVSRGVLPAINTGAVNPMESAQGANPYDKTNPFSEIKVNPFE